MAAKNAMASYGLYDGSLLKKVKLLTKIRDGKMNLVSNFVLFNTQRHN